MNVVQVIERNAHQLPRKDALRAGGATLGFEELLARSYVAAGMLQTWGVKGGDRVALMSHNTLDFAVALFGTLLAGAAAVPVNHELAAPELDYILEHSRARVLLFDGALAAVATAATWPVRRGSLDSTVSGVEHFDPAHAGMPSFSPVAVSDDDFAEVLYTSGTTGKPKGCVHSHRNVVAAAIAGALAVKLDESDRMLVGMPLWHSSPLNNWFMGAQYVGATTVLLREYQPLAFLEAVQRERCTVFFGAPVSYLLPLQTVPGFDSFDLGSMRAWIYGGGPIGVDTARALIARYRTDRFYQVYGLTEAGPTGTVLLPEEQVAKAGSIGRRSLPGADLVVIKNDGHEAKPGEVGEIWLRADSMMKGYLHEPAATSAAFTRGWLRTGDVARVDADGYLFIVDRTRDMVIVGGENVYSKVVEDALGAHPGVAQVAVVGKPHADWGETVVALVVRAKGSQVSAGELLEFATGRLARNELPREIVFVDRLPMTPSGKVKKFELRARPELDRP